MTSSEQNYLIANAVLSGIFLPPLFILFIVTLFLIRRRNDPARSGVAWVKAAIPFLFLSVLATVVADVMFVFVLGDDFDGGAYDSLYQGSDYASIASNYIEQLSTVMTLIGLVHLGRGFLYYLSPPAAANASQASPANKDGSSPPATATAGGGGAKTLEYLRFGVIFVALVLFSLVTAALGLAASAYSVYFSALFDEDSDNSAFESAIDTFNSQMLAYRDINATFDILVWVLSIPLIGLAGYVVHKARGTPVKGTAVIYLVAAVLWFVRFLWHLIYNAAWLLPKNRRGTPISWEIADPILNVWTYFVVLVLLVVVGARKQNGLWTTPQLWMQAAAPIGPVAYNYGPGAGVPGQQQQQQQQQAPYGYNNSSGNPSYGYGYQPSPQSSPSPAQPQQQVVHQLSGQPLQQPPPNRYYEMAQSPPQQFVQQVPANPQELYSSQQGYQQPSSTGYSSTPPTELKT